MTAKNFGELLAEAHWRASDAVSLAEAALDRATREEGPEGSTVGDTLIPLSVLRMIAHRGDLRVREECTQLAERGVAIMRKYYDPRDRRLGKALRILGTHQAVTRLNEAFASLEEAIEIFEHCNDHGEEARLARQWFCDVAFQLGRYNEAHQGALSWKALIPHRGAVVESVSARQVAGRSLLSLDRPLEAIAHLEEALQIAINERVRDDIVEESRKLLEEAKAAAHLPSSDPNGR